MRSREVIRQPVFVRELEVQSIRDITPRMRRIVFSGPDLHAHECEGLTISAFSSTGFDDDVRLIFPHPRTGARPKPAHRGDGTVEWNAETKELFRAYTVRRWDAQAGEVTIDFARHTDGLAERWSSEAEVGMTLWAAGPKLCASLPTHRDWLLLAGDETALPAISRALETIAEQSAQAQSSDNSHADEGANIPVRAFIEVSSKADIQDLPQPPHVSIRWVIRGAETGEGSDLASVVLGTQWPAGSGYAWIAGEAGRIRPLRSELVNRGFAPEDVEITGYWRDPLDL